MGWWLQLRGQRPATSRPIRAKRTRGSHLSISLVSPFFFLLFSLSLSQAIK